MILLIRMAKHTSHPVLHSQPHRSQKKAGAHVLESLVLLSFGGIVSSQYIQIFQFSHSLNPTTATHAIICQQLLSRASLFLLFPCTSTCNLVCNNTPSQDHHLPLVQTLCSTADSQFSSICPTLAFHLSYQQTFVCSRVCTCLDTFA